MFKANPGQYWTDLHLIPAGTRLRLARLLRWFGVDDEDYIILAEILDGEFRGEMVRVPFAGGNVRKKGTLHLNPNMGAVPVETANQE